MRHLTWVLFLLLIPIVATAQPTWFPDGDWQEIGQPYQIYVSNGDTAWVYPTPNGDYGRAQESPGWRYRCPGMIEGDYWTLTATTDSLTAAQQVVGNVVTDGDGSQGTGMVGEMIECIDAFQQHLDTLDISGLLGQEKGWTYATACITSVYNATIHIPSSTGLAEAGDTVAVYRGDTCAGYGVWGGGTTLAAAGTDSVEISPDGYLSGDTIRVEVYDVSEGVAYRPEVTWAACDTMGVPICAEGTYDDGTFHQIASLD